MKAGTSTELPFWLADQLALGRQPLISVDLPQIYKESYREILKADASVINLQKFNLYFYELGLHVKKFDVRGELTDTLLHVRVVDRKAYAVLMHLILILDISNTI